VTADSWEVESASHKHGDERARSWWQEACNASAVNGRKAKWSSTVFWAWQCTPSENRVVLPRVWLLDCT
jgi:hypothetical protein